MCGTEVCENASTAMPPFVGLIATPAFSSPRLATFGWRPIANITWSDATLDPFDRCEVKSSPCLSTPVTVQPVRMVMPAFSISVRTWARTSSSKPRKMLSPR